MSAPQREEWNSVLGFILAAAGSAVGLGNIWRFPYIVGKNGGGNFVLLYLLIVFLLGLPVMYLELAAGRKTKRGPVGAIKALAPGSFWKFLGYLAVITGIAILSYYGVVAGWTIYYLFHSIFFGFESGNTSALFNKFTSNGLLQISLLFIFIGITTSVVFFGIKGGIEKISKVLMPLLLILMLGLIIYCFTLPNASKGLEYYFMPRFSEMNTNTFIFALGQAFFSLSLGMGAMMTYGSYLKKSEKLLNAGFVVIIFDTAIAIMAGLIIFPVIGGAPEKASAGLVFVVITDLFTKIPGGQLLAIFFFLLLSIAALTSTISLLEVAASYLIDEHKISRKKATVSIGFITFLVGIPSALSQGATSFFTKFIKIGDKHLSFLDSFDFAFGNISLALGALLLVLFVIFKWKFQNAKIEIFRNQEDKLWLSYILKPLVLFAVPAAICIVLGFIIFTGKTLS
ncbi:MAG: sodium-dependent transporter [Deltaproteobacteria bacterium]|jgi:NSS family neurotransmitter:Na+ symporter|nr:sodium-dependent transporter [Deltaproteobacteria bacterium]